MSLPRIDTGETATPLEVLKAQTDQAMEQAGNAALREALAISNDKCNALIDRQNTLIEDLTTTVKSLDSANARNARELKESVSSAVSEMRNLQDEQRKLNNEIAAETRNAIRQTRTTLESELRNSIAVQSKEVFSEVRKEIDESKKLLESTREELRAQSGFRKFLFWATPILLIVQTVALIVSLI